MATDQGQNSTDQSIDPPRPWWRRILRLAKRLALLLLSIAFVYLVIVGIGLIPVNNDFEPTSDGVPIMVVSNAVHADLVLPLVTETMDWRKHFPPELFRNDTTNADCVSIGWGDRGFFLETPTWADLKASVVAKALLWPSGTCMHIELTKRDFIRGHGPTVTISESQYEALVKQITASFKKDDDGNFRVIPNQAYGPYDAFFEAKGNYHALNTCNSWVGDCLSHAGVKVGWMTPLPKTVTMYFP